MKLHKISAALASVALVSSVFASSAFASSITISGNLSKSVNIAAVKTTTNCTLDQYNLSQITTEVYNSANTGKNKVKDNNGSSSTTTGNASNTTTIGITGSSNTASNPCCGCQTGSTDVSITNNGKKSLNGAVVWNSSTQTLTQGNESGIGTSVTSKANSGKNEVKDNTGGGSNTVTTKDASNTTTITIGGSSNSL